MTFHAGWRRVVGVCVWGGAKVGWEGDGGQDQESWDSLGTKKLSGIGALHLPCILPVPWLLDHGLRRSVHTSCMVLQEWTSSIDELWMWLCLLKSFAFQEAVILWTLPNEKVEKKLEVNVGDGCCLVAQLCRTLCYPMDCSTPWAGFPVLHYLPEFAQTHVHWVGDAIQASHSLLSPSPPMLDISQHQGLFQWIGPSHQVAKILELQR